MKRKILLALGTVFIVTIAAYSTASAAVITLDPGTSTSINVNGTANVAIRTSNSVSGSAITDSATDTAEGTIALGHRTGSRIYALHSNGGALVAGTKDTTVTVASVIATIVATGVPGTYTTGNALSN